jgi:hypothetical protein
LGGIGVELRASYLLGSRQSRYHFLCWLCLRQGLTLCPPNLDCEFPIFALLNSWDDRHVQLCSGTGWDGVSRTSCLD